MTGSMAGATGAAMHRGGPARAGSSGGSIPPAGFAPWLHWTGGPIRSAPVVVGGLVYATSLDGGVYAVGASDGRLRWRFGVRHGGVDSSPAIVDGALYITSGDHHVYALDAVTGEQRWGSRRRWCPRFVARRGERAGVRRGGRWPAARARGGDRASGVVAGHQRSGARVPAARTAHLRPCPRHVTGGRRRHRLRRRRGRQRARGRRRLGCAAVEAEDRVRELELGRRGRRNRVRRRPARRRPRSRRPDRRTAVGAPDEDHVPLLPARRRRRHCTRSTARLGSLRMA